MKAIAFGLILLLGACVSSPIASVQEPASSLSQRDLAAEPPAAIILALRDRGEDFVPLPAADLGAVRITAGEARQRALANGRDQTNPWIEVGFTYLGLWTQSWDPHESQPEPQPAYVVQVLSEPLPGFPGQNTAYVVVDAATGDPVSTSSPCIGPTCGFQ